VVAGAFGFWSWVLAGRARPESLTLRAQRCSGAGRVPVGQWVLLGGRGAACLALRMPLACRWGCTPSPLQLQVTISLEIRGLSSWREGLSRGWADHLLLSKTKRFFGGIGEGGTALSHVASTSYHELIGAGWRAVAWWGGWKGRRSGPCLPCWLQPAKGTWRTRWQAPS